MGRPNRTRKTTMKDKYRNVNHQASKPSAEKQNDIEQPSVAKAPKIDANLFNKPEYPKSGFESFGGYEPQFLEACRLAVHLKHPEVYTRLGIAPPKGFLLHGPPGCGKSAFARALAGELGLPIFCVSSTELVSGVSGESEKKIRTLFTKASESAPALLLLDDIDAIGAKRENAQREMERRIVIQLIASLDELGRSTEEQSSTSTSAEIMVIDDALDQKIGVNKGHVLVIGTTNKPEVLDASLRRAGRFDKEIALGIPDERTRRKILEIVTRGMKLADDIQLQKLARLTPGYVGADLHSLVREASLSAMNRIFETVLNSQKSEKPELFLKPCNEEMNSELSKMLSWLKMPDLFAGFSENVRDFYVQMGDFTSALSIVHPSAKREGFATVPDVSWEDIGALKKIRSELEWFILNPIKYPEEFELFGASARPQGILLCGPPGCGKTLLAKAVANETGMNFISVKGPELLSMYVGESERAVRTVFQRARDSSPCVIFFDEIDALCPKRSQRETAGSSRLVNQLLTEMDGLEERKQVFLIGATNRPDIVDPAILRPGRLDKTLFVDFPDANDRAEILRTTTKNGTHPRVSQTLNFEDIANNPRIEFFTGADLTALVHEASVVALKQRIEQRDEKVNCITVEHFEKAMHRMLPSVGVGDRERYQKMKKLYTSNDEIPESVMEQ